MSFFGYGDGYRTYLIRLDAISMIFFCEGKRDDIPDANAELEITAGGMHSHNIRGAFAREAFERLKAELGIEDGPTADGLDEADPSQEPYMSAATRELVLQGIAEAKAGDLVPGPDLGTDDDPEESDDGSPDATPSDPIPQDWPTLPLNIGDPRPMPSDFDSLPVCAVDAKVTFSKADCRNHNTVGMTPVNVKASVRLAISPVHIDEDRCGESRPYARTRFLFLGQGDPDEWNGWRLHTGDFVELNGKMMTIVGAVFPTCTRRHGSDGVSYIRGWGVFAELIA